MPPALGSWRVSILSMECGWQRREPNPAPWAPVNRGGLDSLYASTLLAIRPKTGELVWHYQYTPNDVYDVDGTDEPVLADIVLDGQKRKVLFQVNKNGFMYTIDRTNGKLIAAHAFTRVNWATHIDLKTGRPVLTDLGDRFTRGEEVSIYPQRGVNAVPIAFNPNTRLIYTSSWDLPRIIKLAPPAEQVIGTRSTGIVTTRRHEIQPGEVVGHHIAMDPISGKKKCAKSHASRNNTHPREDGEQRKQLLLHF